MIDLDLLNRCFQLQQKDTTSGNVPNHSSYLVFDHQIPINASPPDEHSSSSVAVEVAIGEDGLLVLAPRALQRSEKTPKKRKLSQLRNSLPRVVTALTLATDVQSDILLAADLRRNRAIMEARFVSVTGPELAINDNSILLRARVELLANAGPLSSPRFGQSALMRLFARALNDETLANPEPYRASAADLLRVLTRAPRSNAPEIHAAGLLTPLLPFQRESVQWCLRREGKDLELDGSVVDLDPAIRDCVVTPPLGWRQTADGQLWINPYSVQTATLEPRPPPFKGEYAGMGLLAEEMGLGKTLEIIALIILHPRNLTERRHLTENLSSRIETPSNVENTLEASSLHSRIFDLNRAKTTASPYQRLEPRPIKATLVIVPPVILTQWQNELESHAPCLNVVFYEGRHRGIHVEELAAADVVLASYTVVSAEVHSATFNPGKHNTRYWHLRTDIESVRSPLVQVQFWRVVLDEVQMIHTGISNAAKVARLVPRIHAWGVTGTPVKTSITDLRGLLLFLDVEPFVEAPAWQRMIASPVDFSATMNRIGMRHTKPLVASQLHLPPQRRVLIPLRFSQIERHHYDNLVNKFNDQMHPNRLSWLIRLRQACCHASLSHRDPAAPILTVDQVLARLVDDAEATVYAKLRARLILQLELGQLLDKAARVADAVVLWQKLAVEVGELSKEYEKRLEKLQEDVKYRRDILDKLTAELAADESGGAVTTVTVKDEAEIEYAEHALAMAQARVQGVKSRVRSLQEMLHRAYFFMGTGYFRLNERLAEGSSKIEDVAQKGPSGDTASIKKEEPNGEFSALETLYYDRAESLRQELLGEEAERVHQLGSRVKEPTVHNVPSATPGSETLNASASYIRDMGDHLLRLLRTPLLDKEAAVENDVYAESLDDQEHAFILLDLLQIALKDRSVLILGGNPPPNPKDIRSEKKDKTPVDTKEENNEVDLRAELLKRRDDIRPDWAPEPLYSVARRVPELSPLVDRMRDELREWNRELGALRDLYNGRLEYYKQLQMLSDRVVDIETPPDADIRKLVQDKRAAVHRAERATLHFESKLRYVRDLEVTTAPELREGEDPTSECPICQEDYELGSLTACGHRFCTNCIMTWWEIRGSCPICKRKIGSQDMIQFRTRQMDAAARPASRQNSIIMNSESEEIYTPLSNSTFNSIARIPIERPYGIKVDMIARHIKWLRAQDETAQVVIFSQWAQMLKMVAAALHENGLETAGISDGAAMFRTNTDVACFLLHAKSDAAGLTLVNASHVVLCEPLLNTAVELQAISRIHRIGQTQETTVWLFCVEDTVEEAILALTTRRRIRHLADLRKENIADDDADSSILASSTGTTLVDKSSGSEVVADSDMNEVLYWKSSADLKTVETQEDTP